MLTAYQDAYTFAMDRSREPVGYVLKRAQAALRLAMDEALHAHDLSMAQYALLTNLEHESALTNAELARRAFVTPQTTIRIVADLEAAGLVERTADPDNRRRLNTSLTPAGRTRLHAADSTVNDVEERMLHGFSAAEIDQFRTLLRQTASNLAVSDDRTAPSRRSD